MISTRERCSHTVQQNQLKIVNHKCSAFTKTNQSAFQEQVKYEFLKTTLIFLYFMHISYLINCRQRQFTANLNKHN